MKGLIINELHKEIRSRKLILFIALIIILGLMQCFILYEHKMDMDYFNSREGQIEYFNRQIQDIKEVFAITGEDESLREEMLLLEDELRSIEAMDDETFNHHYLVNNFWNLRIENLKAQKLAYPEHAKDLDKIIEISEQNKEKGISGNFGGLNAMYFLYSFMSQVMSLFLLAGLAFFQGDSMSGEFSRGSVRLLLAQPRSRIKLYLAKLLSAFFISASVIIVVEMLMSLVIGFIYGFGEFHYQMVLNNPVLWLENNNSYDLIPKAIDGFRVSSLGMIGFGLINQILQIFCSVSFIILLSSLFSSSLIAVGIPIGISVAWTLAQRMLLETKHWWPYFFFAYQDSFINLSNPQSLMSFFQIRGLTFVSVEMGYLVMLLSSLVFIILGLCIFRKRDITF